MANRLNVIVQLQVEGFHFWKDAPDIVGFLRDSHRHMFHIKCVKEVSHGDRDVEIILFKRAIYDHLMNRYKGFGGNYCIFGSRSCEQIAEELIEAFDLVSAEVLEDGENGSIVYAE